MKMSSKIALGFVGGLTAISLLAVSPKKPTKRLNGYKYLAVKKIIAKKKTVSVRSGSTGRSYSGGGSSYGK